MVLIDWLKAFLLGAPHGLEFAQSKVIDIDDRAFSVQQHCGTARELEAQPNIFLDLKISIDSNPTKRVPWRASIDQFNLARKIHEFCNRRRPHRKTTSSIVEMGAHHGPKKCTGFKAA